MAKWVLKFERKNFDLTDYVPLDGIFTEPFHVYVKYRYYYYSTIYHQEYDYTVEISYDLTGYDSHHNHPTYPCLACYLAYPGTAQCGPVLWGAGGNNNYSYDNVQGYIMDNKTAIETPITTPGYGSTFNGQYTENAGIEIESCNIPVILENANPSDYGNYLWYMGNPDTSLNINQYDPDGPNPITDEILSKAVNWDNDEYNNKTEDYYIYNTYEAASIDMGIVTYTGDAPTGRFEIFKANSEPVFYYVDKEHSLELKLMYSDIVGSVYSSINKEDVLNKQFDVNAWTRKALYYDGPFYNVLKYMPDGDYTIGVTMDTNIYIAPDRQTALDYLAGLVPAEDMENYGNVGRPDIAENETGEKELITSFGGNLSENVFSHDYLMTRTQLADVGGKFFDTNIITALLDGLKLYGNNPMDSVLSCLYFPFDLSSVCTYTAVTSIFFGSYEMENVSANKVSTRSGYKELGSTFIKPTFYNWLDYEAMHIYLYLPYIGFVELDVSKYLNKWLKIVYMVDLHSGECEVSLCADGLLMDTYSGQIGIKQPITYNDLATYFQSQITALRNGVMSSVGLPVGSAAAGAGVGSQAGPYGAAVGAIAGSAVTAPFVAPNAIYQGLKVANYKPPLFSKGGYSSEIGANMPQYAFLVFMYNDIQEPDNLVDIFGKPSNESGTVGSFNGFLSVSSVNLQCSGATDAEKSEIVSLLHSGIYI